MLVVLTSAACANREQTTSAKPPHGTPATVPVRQPPLRPLDQTTAAEFRRAFDEPGDRTRFIVALSPT